MLSLENVTISYGAAPVVEEVFFQIFPGERVGLFGANGCGKTSVAMGIMGMIPAFGGEICGNIFYKETELLSLSPVQMKKIRWREISIVSQFSMSALNPSFTLEKTFLETFRAHGEKGRQTEALLALTGLDNSFLKRYPHQLSGGQLGRVSIALALALSPKLLILDEATTGLDPLSEADILYAIKQIQEERGLSLLFISHDRRLQKAFCHRSVDL